MKEAMTLATSKLKLAPLILWCLLSTFAAADEPTPEARGVWMSREVIRAGPARMEQVFRSLAQGNFNSVFVGAWYTGGTIYPSAAVARVGGPQQLPEFAGRDPLREAIDIAHRWGLEVIAWMEYGLMIHYGGSDSLNSGPIIAKHPEWEAVNKNGQRFFFSGGGYFHWLDPAHPEVAQFMEDLHAELAAKYPDLDGIEIDRIRYPSLDFSYSALARSRYQQETGGSDPLQINASHPEWSKWVKWREQQTTAIARRIHRRVKALNPRTLVCAAVVPPYMLAGSSKLQAWPLWADSGYVDVLEPMLYLNDADFPNQLGEALRAAPADFYLYPGLGLIDNDGRYRGNASAEFQISKTREMGGKGVTIWDYRALTEATLAFLKTRLFTTPSNLPHNDVIVDNSAATQFEANGLWMQLSGGYRNGHLAAPAGDGSHRAVWRPKLYKAGRYEIHARWVADAANATNARYEVSIGAQTKSKIVDQRRNGEQWVFLLADSIPYGAPASVRLTNQADGRVVADAVRFVISKKLALLDLNVPDGEHLDLKFNRAPLRETAEQAANYAINLGVAVVSAKVDSRDPAIVHLTTAPLQPEVDYTLTITGLKDEADNRLDNWQVPFRYAPALTQFVLDNRDQNFHAIGNWTAATAEPGFIGSDYLVSNTGAGENRAQWWNTIGMDGYYEVAAIWPGGGSDRATRVPYFILHGFGTDTVWANQRVNGGAWTALGVYQYAAGQFASVSVRNAVTDGKVIADAVRFQRVLQTAAAQSSPQAPPLAFHLFQNYPNPFNPRTTIAYQLAHDGHVLLQVFDLLGHEVVNLVDKVQAAGNHQVTFEGNGLTSGVYVSQLRYRPSGSPATQVQTRKLVLMR